MKYVIIITGPTASGKTTLAHHLAVSIGSEIIVADSMKVYRETNITTSKPPRKYRDEIKYHLIDIIDPTDEYDVGTFYRDSCIIIDSLHNKGKIPIVCGGTSLYISKLIEGLAEIPKIPGNIMENLMAQPVEKLYKELKAVDPERAGELHPNMKKRIARALGIYKYTGEKMSKLILRTKPPDYNFIVTGISWDRQILYDRINKRVDKMINDGLLEETIAIYDKYGPNAPVFEGVGYRQLLPYLKNEINFDKAVEDIKKSTRNYAKRQLTWWRGRDVIWLDGSKLFKHINFPRGNNR